jgi:prepilin-type N-terminal cleavage/methylation domain-containing protein
MQRPRIRGFSLIEVMTASTLFLITVVGVLSATRTAASAYEHERRLTQAVAVGEFALEELLLRYTTSSELATNTTQDASGILQTATPYTRCLRADLQTSTSCTTANLPTQVGMAAGLTPAVKVGQTGSYGISWTVSRPTAVNTLRHIRLFIVWQEATGIRTLELQTYRP